MDSGIADGTESAVWCGELDGDKVAVALLPGAEVKRDVWPDVGQDEAHKYTHTYTHTWRNTRRRRARQM